MDDKKYLTEQIRKCRYKMNTAKKIDCGILFAAAGGTAAILFELVSLVWEFYYVHLAAGLCFLAGFLAGICYAVWKRVNMEQAARRLDSFGLKERMVTAYEQMDSETEFARLQRQDAYLHYQRVQDQIRISLLPDKRHVLALLLSVAVAVGTAFIPSPVREQANTRHQVQQQAKEEQETLEELLNALEGVDMDQLTEEQKAQLEELMEAMKLSREELAKADSWESLMSATEKLNYKYDQAGQSLERLAGQMDDPGAAGIASAEALAKAAANQNGSQTASSGTQSGSNGTSDGTSDGSSGENGEGDGSGSGEGDGTGSGNGDGEGEGSGSGEGDGSGNGEGEGSGSGNGEGGANGGGSGRGTGSSNAVHDYVSIPNAVAEDASLTGEKTGDQNSDYYRQQNGLAWEGDHVDYSSVIGEYTEGAYEGIANGRYPSGMESVIRDYFGSLNQ